MPSRCDNSTEFKGTKPRDFKSVCEKWSIPIVRGRDYHPENQETVEIANRTFKRRLKAIQTELSTRKKLTPYEVFYGRPPLQWDTLARVDHYRRAEVADESIERTESDIIDFSNDKVTTNDDHVFMTALEKRMANNYLLVADRMVRKRERDQIVVSEQDIVLFEFLKQLRTSLEALTIPVRIIEMKSVAAKLYSQYKLIKGMHLVSQFTVCPMAGTWDALIPTDISAHSKAHSITLPKAVQREFGRGPLSALQKAGREKTAALKIKRGTEATAKAIRQAAKSKAGKKAAAIAVAKTKTTRKRKNDTAPPALSTRSSSKKAKKSFSLSPTFFITPELQSPRPRVFSPSPPLSPTPEPQTSAPSLEIEGNSECEEMAHSFMKVVLREIGTTSYKWLFVLHGRLELVEKAIQDPKAQEARAYRESS
ncbi:hypothetical protein BDZ45DRAFT_696722 [Acephala macrosclerotiorum]|nr:hypothetical protein BDZ45DRAFT_696722 [Acephala macrosclerotiorum]